ncbi:MAG: rbsA 1, partial [Solirubrobacterales bacterium]|nr:rbsA 1 [Solirubrobacterales bacterium]
PGVKALTDASLICEAGKVHALVGENGAGKSTLIKVACGALRADEGTVHIGGQELTRPTPVAARRLGLLTAYQDTSLVPGLSVAENVLLSFHGVKPLGFRTRLKEAAAMLEPYDLSFGPDVRVGSLSPGSKQLLEVVRAIVHRPKVLLLDEPTAALDAANIAKLEGLIASALEHGTAVLYITHRLDEVQRIADQLTVIRDGQIQGTYAREAWEVDDIVAMMVGVRTDLAFPPKPARTGDEPIVVSTRGFHGAGFGPIDFDAGRGEIVGIAGAEGNGQHEFVRTLVGLRSGRGDVTIEGTAASLRTPAAARKRGIVFQSGDRAAESVFRELSVMDNATLAARKELGPVGLIMASRQRKLYEPVAEDLGIVAASPYQPAAQLSGGNQQKAVVARSIIDPAKVLVVDEPTQGVDARARLDIYRALRRQADDGVAVVVNSSDASELVGLCDRVYVMSRGRVVRELAGDDVKESAIVSAFVNVGAGKQAADAAAVEEQVTGHSRRTLAIQSVLGSTWTPLAVIVLLMLIIGGYTASFTSVFLQGDNLTSLLVIALPLMVVALGQQSALIAGGFDISIGSSMTLGVILASFWVTQDTLAGSIPGILLCLVVGVGIGLLNAFVIRGLGVSPIIATIGTLGVLNGIGILLRPEPGGLIGTGISDALNKQVGFVPISFIGVVVVAVICEMWLRSTARGLSVRATGLSEEASRRTGIQVERIKVGAYVFCAVLAVAAGLFLAVQVAVGQNGIASTYALPAFTACFLGGAALTGGRGSFVGAVLGAVFLTLLINVTPLLQLESAWAQTATGVLTILAVVAYSLTGDNRRVSVRWRSRDTFVPQDEIALPRPGEDGTLESVANTAERP